VKTKLPIQHSILIYFGLALVFNLQIINYFFEFNEGVVKGGESLRLVLKFISISMIYIFIVKLNKYIFKENILALGFFSIALLLILIRIPFFESRDWLFINNFLAVPILLGSTAKFNFKAIDQTLLVSFFLWISLDFYNLQNSNTMWGNKAFIGGVGNPSSYGLILIYLYEVSIKNLSLNKVTKRVLKALIFINLIMTQALMPILIFLYLRFLRKGKQLFFVFISSIIIIYNLETVLFYMPGYHWKLKLESLLFFLNSSDTLGSSASILTRIDFLEDFFILFENPKGFFIGNINNSFYNSGDSQYVTYATSFGIILFLIFLYYIVKLVRDSYKTKYFNFFIALTLILVTNRILDYWPIPILIYLTINRFYYERRNS